MAWPRDHDRSRNVDQNLDLARRASTGADGRSSPPTRNLGMIPQAPPACALARPLAVETLPGLWPSSRLVAALAKQVSLGDSGSDSLGDTVRLSRRHRPRHRKRRHCHHISHHFHSPTPAPAPPHTVGLWRRAILVLKLAGTPTTTHTLGGEGLHRRIGVFDEEGHGSSRFRLPPPSRHVPPGRGGAAGAAAEGGGCVAAAR
jgi:hypothetical protein